MVGVATASAPAGEARVEGVPVLRLPARPPLLARIARTRRGAPRERHASPSTSRLARTRSKAPRKPHPLPSTPRPARAHGEAPRELHASRGASPLTPVGRARRTLSGLSFTLQALSVARRVKPRLVHANDWNTMWAGLCIKLLCGSLLVYDSHELWADRNGRWEWRPWLLACEAMFVRCADEVLTSSPGYAGALAARYRIPRPSVVRNIPEGHRDCNGLDAHEGGGAFASTRDARRCEPALPPSRPEVPLVVYIGGLMPGRGLEQMIDALPLIPAARLRAVGPGASSYRGSLLARAEEAGVLDRVELRCAVLPAEVPEALAEATAGLCLIQPICRSYELCLPNKLFEYAAAGVPVLASDLPVIGALVRREGFGALAPATDPPAIAASLERLLEPDGWRLAAQRARAFAAAHSWDGEAHTLTDTYTRAQARTGVTGAPA